MKTKSALPWYGSDAGVARQIAELLDECNHVTIPFCGGLGILPHLKAKGVVANDLNRHAINFYRMAGDPRLHEMCANTLSHPAELDVAKALCDSWIVVERAWAYWARCWVGRKGSGGTTRAGDTVSVRWSADGGNNASRLAAAAADIQEWAKHFRRCEFTCRDFREVLGKVHDYPSSGIYADPPWVTEGDAYEHTFREVDHSDLAAILSSFEKTKVVVRYGDHPMVRSLYNSGWTFIEETSRTQANRVRGEVWITRNINGKATC